MASAQVFETSVPNKGPSQDSNHPDDLFQSKLSQSITCLATYMNAWYKYLITWSKLKDTVTVASIRQRTLEGGELVQPV